MLGYARASSEDQESRRQTDALWRFGVSTENIYVDAANGWYAKRPLWQACMHNLQSGDLLVVTSIDRLGHDLAEIIAIILALRDKGVDITTLNADLDTTTPHGRQLVRVMSGLAEWEQRAVQERRLTGLAMARARGLTARKPKITHEQALQAMARIQSGESARVVAAEYNVSRQAIYQKAEEARRMDLGP
jgi:DNA invertase Pin-like site-specific DNA recombinase